MGGEHVAPFIANETGGEKRSRPRGLTVSTATSMHVGAPTRLPVTGRAGAQAQWLSDSKFEAETLAVAHHPAAAGAGEMPADHKHRRSGKPPQERPAGAIGLRSIEIGGC